MKLLVIFSDRAEVMQRTQLLEAAVLGPFHVVLDPYIGDAYISRGSRYLIIKDVGLKDRDYYGFGGPSPYIIIWYVDPLG